MKKILFIALFACAAILAAHSQAKKPTFMVVPSDAWCNMVGYTTTFDNQGVYETLPDYNAAVSNDPNLLLVISKLGEMMIEYSGFEVKDLGASLRSLRNEAAEESVTMSKDGDVIAESPVDRLRRVAKADIWMQLTFHVNRVGPKYSLTFNLQGIDAYSNKQIAAASGTSEPSSTSEIPVLLEEAVLAHIKRFVEQLEGHVKDMEEKGREVSLVCRRWSGSDIDFETEFDGEELSFIIEEWMADNTVQGRFSTTDMTENRMSFDQVRIPLYNESGRAIDARTWANGLRKELKDKYQIDAKLGMKGLGQAVITIGAK